MLTCARTRPRRPPPTCWSAHIRARSDFWRESRERRPCCRPWRRLRPNPRTSSIVPRLLTPSNRPRMQAHQPQKPPSNHTQTPNIHPYIPNMSPHIPPNATRTPTKDLTQTRPRTSAWRLRRARRLLLLRRRRPRAARQSRSAAQPTRAQRGRRRRQRPPGGACASPYDARLHCSQHEACARAAAACCARGRPKRRRRPLQGRVRLLKRHEAHMMRSARGHALRHVRLLQALANERARPRRSARGAHELPLGEPPCIARPLPPLRKPHARR